jgi:uncharacterized protein YceH (UPF0502 family)
MIELNPEEARVLGVLVEKAYTTPAQYPLSLNAVVTGCNQKSNRFPTTNYDEDRALRALDRLRSKSLVTEVHSAGGRTPKYRQEAMKVFELRTAELVVLAELLLRGPQTVGELRGRASRMHPLDSTQVVETVLKGLMEREPPLVQRVAPQPGSRAERYAQLLSPGLHRLESGAPTAASSDHAQTSSTEQDASVSHRRATREELEERVERLERAVARMYDYMDGLAQHLGEAGPPTEPGMPPGDPAESPAPPASVDHQTTGSAQPTGSAGDSTGSRAP